MNTQRLDLIGLDGKAVSEEHEEVRPVPGAGLRILDGPVESWVPWASFLRATITPLDPDVRKPEVRDVPERATGGRRAR